MNEQLKSKFLNKLRQSGIQGKFGKADSNLFKDADINQIKSILQSGNSKDATQAYDVLNDILKGETRENFNKLNNQVREAQLNTNEANKKLEENQRENQRENREDINII